MIPAAVKPWLVLAAIGAAAAWVITRPGVAFSAAKAGAGAAVDLTEEVFGGAVVGIGEQVGIPATDADQCAADLAAGRTWAASFSCPAGRWLRSLVE